MLPASRALLHSEGRAMSLGRLLASGCRVGVSACLKPVQAACHAGTPVTRHAPVSSGLVRSMCSAAGGEGDDTADASSGAKKLWGGRFTGETDPLMEAFNASIGFDKKLYAVDIAGSKAYARGLARAGVLTNDEADTLVAGLGEVHNEWEAGTFELQPGDEDIHTANERRLTELVGPVGGKLHTGRSRNDQVATDVRLWLRSEIVTLRRHLEQLIATVATRAEKEVDIIMPGYTHLQPAQPIRWAHWLLSYGARWQRDAERLAEIQARVDVMPLGSGALAGHTFGLDREELARDLKFGGGPSANSLDAVSDRDFIIETLFWASMTATHLSQFAEDLIIYSTKEFGYVKLSDAYSTGSSLMPQKKNPDALELLRGKSGRVIGKMAGLLVTVKGLPSSFNKDLQEDKEPLFDIVATMAACLPIATGVLSTLTPNPERMTAALDPAMLATDLADYLVRRGVPFRESHHVAGEAIVLAETTGRTLFDISADELKAIHPVFEDDVVEMWDFGVSVDVRDAAGGTGRAPVVKQVADMKRWLANYSDSTTKAEKECAELFGC